MISAQQIHEIAKIVMSKEYDFGYIGLRIQESTYGQEIGQEIDHHSMNWDDGIMQEDEIDGICAVDASAAAGRVLSFGYYSGDVVIVLGSNNSQYGEDDGEIILKSVYGNRPVILDIIQVQS
jgi:hypothetical protein